MKAKSRISKGFTLIELLVVIAIIGLLAAIIVPALTGGLRAAKRARAMGQIRDLDGAIRRFISEYGVPPLPKGVKIIGNPDGDREDIDQEFIGDGQAQIIQILCNWDDDNWPGGKRNKKQIVFLDLDPASFMDEDGKPCKTVDQMKDALINNYYQDPWGNPYGILLDLDLDDRIIGLFEATAENPIRAKVGVYSLGEKGEANKDDPPYKTW